MILYPSLSKHSKMRQNNSFGSMLLKKVMNHGVVNSRGVII